KLTFCILPGRLLLLSVTTSAPLRLPAPAGVNVTLIVQVPPFAASMLPQVLADTAKSVGLAPEIPTLVMFKVAVPVLLNVTDRGALVVVSDWLPKVKLLVERPATGAGGPPPVPV